MSASTTSPTTGRAVRARSHNYTVLFAIVAAGALLLLGIIYFMIPASRALLTDENMVMETLSALFFLLGGLGALGLVLARNRGGRRLFYLLVALLGIAGFLDEIGFGQSYVDFEAPRFQRWQINGLHDFALPLDHYARLFLRESAAARLAVLAGLLLALIALVVFRRQAWAAARRFSRLLWHDQELQLLALSLGLIAMGVLFEFKFFRTRLADAVFLEESVEMFAGLALLFLVIAAVDRRRRPARGGRFAP